MGTGRGSALVCRTWNSVMPRHGLPGSAMAGGPDQREPWNTRNPRSLASAPARRQPAVRYAGERLPERCDDLGHAVERRRVGQVDEANHDLADACLGKLPKPSDVIGRRTRMDRGGVPGRVGITRPEPADELVYLLVIGANQRRR